MTTATSHPFDVLNGHNFMSLTSFRKSGEGVSTPVWFARDGGRLVMLTDPEAYKIKRIRRDPRVTVAPCDFRGGLLGAVAEGRARILENAAEQKEANRLLQRKYGWQKTMFGLMARLRGSKPPVFIEITPAA